MPPPRPTFVDPATDVVGGAETGTQPLAKTASFYNSFKSGKPFSSIPSWADVSHMPPSRRALIARPDLALDAMRRILSRVDKELSDAASLEDDQQQRREMRLDALRTRHEQRHEAQRRIGVLPPTHAYGARSSGADGCRQRWRRRALRHLLRRFAPPAARYRCPAAARCLAVTAAARSYRCCGRHCGGGGAPAAPPQHAALHEPR